MHPFPRAELPHQQHHMNWRERLLQSHTPEENPLWKKAFVFNVSLVPYSNSRGKI